MSKGLIAVYISMLVSVLLLRSSYYSGVDASLEDMTVKSSTDGIRILSSQSSENPVRIEICKATVSNGQSVTTAQLENGKSQLDQYRSLFGEQIGEAIIQGNRPQQNAINQKVAVVSIIAIFAILTPILGLYYCCYCICDQTCPICCKRNPVLQPFTKGEMLCSVIAIAVYCALTLGASIAGYIYSNDINSSYLCSVVAALDDLNLKQTFQLSDGSNVSYMGLNDLKVQLNQVSNDMLQYFDSVNNFVTNQYTNSKKIQDLQSTVVSQLNSLKTLPVGFSTHTQNEDSTTATYTSAMQSQTTDSIFYKQSTYNTYIDGINSIFDVAASATVQSITSAADAANSFVNSGTSSSYKDTITSGIDSVTSGQTFISDSINKINDKTSGVNTAFSYVTIFLMVFYGLFMGIAVIALTVSIIGHVKNWFKARLILNALCSLLTILTVISFLICVLMSVMTIALMETCTQTNKLLNDKSYLLQLNMSTDLVDYMSTCKQSLGGDGKILVKFGVQSVLDTITTTQGDLIDATDSYQVDAYDVFYNQFQVFQNQHQVFEDTGIFYMRTDTDFQTNGPKAVKAYSYTLDYAEAQAQFMNSKTLMGNGDVQNANIYRTDGCVSSTAYDNLIFVDDQRLSVNLKPTGQWPQISSIQCVNIVNDQPTNPQVNTRYNNCADTASIFKDVYQKSNNYIQFMKGKYQVNQQFVYDQYSSGQKTSTTQTAKRSTYIQSITDALGKNQNQFGGLVQNFMDDLNNNVINTSTLLTDRLIGENGIISNVNCLFFGAYIGNFNDQMCSNVSPTVFWAFKVMLIASFSNFTLMILIYKMSKKLRGKQHREEFIGNNGTGDESYSNTMQKPLDTQNQTYYNPPMHSTQEMVYSINESE